MNQAEILLLELFLMFVGAKLLGGIFERLRQPSVIGEIIAGVLLGPSLLGLIYPNEVLGALAEMGAIFLLFTVGLEMRPRQLLQVGRTAALVALLGVVFPFVLGFLYMKHAGHQRLDSIFLAAAMVATSVALAASVARPQVGEQGRTIVIVPGDGSVPSVGNSISRVPGANGC